MSESGNRDPIVIPIGFVIDETSLEIAIKEAKRRFADALGTPDVFSTYYGAHTRPGDQTREEREAEDRSVGIYGERYADIGDKFIAFGRDWEDTMDAVTERTIDKLIQTITAVSPITTAAEQSKTEQVKESFIEAILDKKEAIETGGVSIPELIEQKDTTEEILEIADKSMFDEARTQAMIDEIWNYLMKYITNVPGPGGGFARAQPAPLERVTPMGIEEERFRDIALIARGSEDTRKFIGDIVSKLKDEELERAVQNEALMDRIEAITGGITESGVLGYQLWFRGDDLDYEMANRAEGITLMLQDKITRGLLSDPDLFAGLAVPLSEQIIDAFTLKGQKMDRPMTTAEVSVTPAFVTMEAETGISNIVDVFVPASKLLAKMESKFDEEWKPEKRIVPDPLPEFANLAEVFEMARYIRDEKTAVGKELEWVRRVGSTTPVNEGAMQTAVSLPAGKDEIRERRFIEDMEIERSKMEMIAIIDDMLTTVEGLDEIIWRFGAPFATERLHAMYQYEEDSTRLFADIRRIWIAPGAEEGEPFPILKQEEQIRGTDEERLETGLTMEEILPLEIDRAVQGMVKIAIEGEMTEISRQFKGFGYGTLAPIARLGDKIAADARMVEEIWGEQKEIVEELMEVQTGLVPGSGEITNKERMDHLIKQSEEGKQEAFETMINHWLERWIGKLEDLEFRAKGFIEEEPVNAPRLTKTAARSPMSEEDVEKLSTSIIDKMRMLWQQTVGGAFTSISEPVKPRKPNRSKTDISESLEEYDI